MDLLARMPYDLQRCIMGFTPHPAAEIVSERFSKLRRECVDNYAAELAYYECCMELAKDSGDDYWYRIFENGLRVAYADYRATLEGLGGDPDLEVVDP